tara:strand:+ start:237 stop:458 length:222 start_codon:yes stop_codon:yes gene_type:complete
MNRFFFNFIILILVLSCSKDDSDSIEGILDLDGKNLYAAGYYIDSYPNGTQYATYWLNGKRIYMGRVKFLIFR